MPLGLLGEDHGRVAGEIAHRRILGRLHDEARRIVAGQPAGVGDFAQDRGDTVVEEREEVHGGLAFQEWPAV